MSDTLVGGLIALAGTVLGFLGALAIRSLDIRRHLAGSIGTVIAELAMNHTIISHLVNHQMEFGRADGVRFCLQGSRARPIEGSVLEGAGGAVQGLRADPSWPSLLLDVRYGRRHFRGSELQAHRPRVLRSSIATARARCSYSPAGTWPPGLALHPKIESLGPRHSLEALRTTTRIPNRVVGVAAQGLSGQGSGSSLAA